MMLTTPSSFPGDPEGYLGNQAGHAAIGVAGTLLLWQAWGLWAVLAVAVVYFLFWEIGVQRGKLIRDSIADTAHVTAGAGVIGAALSLGHWEAAAIASAEGAALAYGAWRRSE